ncbi:hypothetical protein [Allokutzneria sp. NRRL B-24872]|uniref:hypothetical protein n=1 Tax=Allokutzneria sp. NRRL B-24872 TaxID=1137961 RepID=UPI001177A144|nr:hypothetical protein [Allokutzneria sp. NRRL B-24872]
MTSRFNLRPLGAMTAIAAVLVTGLVAPGTASATASGCNGDVCIKVVGDRTHTDSATVTYRGNENRDWVFVLDKWDGSFTQTKVGGNGTAHTWTTSDVSFPDGKVCGKVRQPFGSAVPGYPCVDINYW